MTSKLAVGNGSSSAAAPRIRPGARSAAIGAASNDASTPHASAPTLRASSLNPPVPQPTLSSRAPATLRPRAISSRSRRPRLRQALAARRLDEVEEERAARLQVVGEMPDDRERIRHVLEHVEAGNHVVRSAERQVRAETWLLELHARKPPEAPPGEL